MRRPLGIRMGKKKAGQEYRAILIKTLSHRRVLREQEWWLLFCPWGAEDWNQASVHGKHSLDHWLGPSSWKWVLKVRIGREKEPGAMKQASQAWDECSKVKLSCSTWKQRKAGQEKNKKSKKSPSSVTAPGAGLRDRYRMTQMSWVKSAAGAKGK